MQQIKERGALPMIDRGGYPSGNRPLQQYLPSLPGAVMVSFEHIDSLIAKFKEGAERSERLMYEQSHRDYLRSGYLQYHRLPGRGLLIITVITPLPTKPSATKMPENWKLANAALPTCRCVSGMLLRSGCGPHEGVSRCCAENDAQDDVAAGHRRLYISSLSVSA